MHKKHFSILVVVALVLSVFAIAVPAQATHLNPDNVQQFMPLDDNSTFGNSKDQLSDKFDGVDSAAHLTAVATTDTDQVSWYVCLAGEQPYEDAGNSQVRTNAGCDLIGTDTTGRQPAGADAHATFADEGYEFFWNIPQTLDNTRRDIVALACIGAPTSTDNEDGASDIPDNCAQDAQLDIFLEDSSDEDDLIAGEIVGICTASGSNVTDTTPNATDAGNRCFNNTDGTSIAVTSRPFNTEVAEHGGNVPEDGFTVRWRTSPDVTSSDVCWDTPADATQPPTVFVNACATGTVEQATPTYTQWIATFTDIADDAEIDLFITGIGSNNSTSTECTTFGVGFCILDEHYVISSERVAAEMVLTFDVDDDTTYEGDCDAPLADVANQLGDGHWVYACFTDQFGDPFPAAITGAGDFTFESVGPEGSGITTCPGTAHDHDGDGRSEHCHVDETDDSTDGSGRFAIFINNTTGGGLTATPGDQTITGCFDAEAGVGTLSTATPPANHGCADEALKQSIVKHWQTAPDQTRLVFYDGTSDREDACLTGDQFKENQTGDVDTLLVCTFDTNGNITSTTPTGSGRLQWFIAPAGGGELTATRFASPPPNETGTDGTATASLEAFRAGNDNITVCLQNDPGGNAVTGDFDDCSVVQKRVTQGGPGPGPGPGPATQCNDGDDNDGDGLIDFPDDPGCGSRADDSEANAGNTPRACRNAGTGVNVITGTDGADAISGTNDSDVICGAGGDDVIDSRGGADLVTGNGGNDTIQGGGAKDNLAGNGGNDSISGQRGNDAIKGGRGSDALKGNKGIDTLSGGGGSDTLQGGAHEDILKGGGGNDTLRGGAAADALDGGDGNDQCFGGAGRDSIRRCE